MGLVFHGIELLAVRYVRLVRHDEGRVRQKIVHGSMLSVCGSFQMLWAAGAVFYVVHGRVCVPGWR